MESPFGRLKNGEFSPTLGGFPHAETMSDEIPGYQAPRSKARFRSRYDDDIYRRKPSPRAPAAEPSPDAPDANGGDPSTVPVEELPAGETAVEAPAAEPDDLLPNFRLNKVYEAPPPAANGLKDWRWLLVTACLLAGGLAGGYYLGLSNAAKAVPNGVVTVKEPAKLVVDPLKPEVQAQVDAAFEATKKGHYPEARDQFSSLREQHPDWWSMSIEAARASLYLHDAQTAQRALGQVSSDLGLPDVDFIMGLLHLTNKELDLAEASFASAVARDPARPDFYYFWGECLRRDGKPLEAVSRFRSALLRNQYENSEGLYQVKLWISQIQADQAEPSGANKEIDTALALPRAPYEALFAASARELRAKRYKEAGDFIARAQAVTEPAVFRVIMQDPVFLEEGNRAEIAPFYH